MAFMDTMKNLLNPQPSPTQDFISKLSQEDRAELAQALIQHHGQGQQQQNQQTNQNNQQSNQQGQNQQNSNDPMVQVMAAIQQMQQQINQMGTPGAPPNTNGNQNGNHQANIDQLRGIYEPALGAYGLDALFGPNAVQTQGNPSPNGLVNLTANQGSN